MGWQRYLKFPRYKMIATIIAAVTLCGGVVFWGASRLVHPISVTNVRTYWLLGVPGADGGTVCVPAIAITVKNNGFGGIKNAIFSATFFEDGKNTTYGGGKTTWSEAAEGVLPHGYSKGVVVASGIGRQFMEGTCVEQVLPKLTVSVTANTDGKEDDEIVDRVPVNNSAQVFYINNLSLSEPPEDLGPK